MLKIYPNDAKNITNKTAYRAATRFQLNAAQGADYKTTPDGRVMVIRDQQRQLSGTNMGGNNAQLQALLDNQKQLRELIAKNMQTRENDRMDKLIGFLEQRAAGPSEETIEDKLLKLGQFIVEKPDIIDRIGYILRPSLYSREPVLDNINGTNQPPTERKEPAQTDPPMEETHTAEGEHLTEAEEQALTDRQNAALDKLEDIIGLHELTEILEALAGTNPDKLQRLTVDKLKSAMAFL